MATVCLSVYPFWEIYYNNYTSLIPSLHCQQKKTGSGDWEQGYYNIQPYHLACFIVSKTNALSNYSTWDCTLIILSADPEMMIVSLTSTANTESLCPLSIVRSVMSVGDLIFHTTTVLSCRHKHTHTPLTTMHDKVEFVWILHPNM